MTALPQEGNRASGHAWAAGKSEALKIDPELSIETSEFTGIKAAPEGLATPFPISGLSRCLKFLRVIVF